MLGNITLAATAIVAVSAYYSFAWLLYGRNSGTYVLIALYDPPRSLSPAMIRYVWKERFDDRTFWAGVLNLVAKALPPCTPKMVPLNCGQQRQLIESSLCLKKSGFCWIAYYAAIPEGHYGDNAGSSHGVGS